MLKLWNFFKNVRLARRNRKNLDYLLSHNPSVEESLSRRLDWFFDVIQWIRSEGFVKSDLDFSTGIPQAARVKYLLQILDKMPLWKESVAKTLRSLIKDTRALELFVNAGIPNQMGVWAEAIERVQIKLFPEASDDRDLVSMFTQTFCFETDAVWIQQIDAKSFEGIVQLFLFHIGESEDWNSLVKDAEEALILLSIQAGAQGMHRWLRERVQIEDFRSLPFFKLPQKTHQFISARKEDERITLSVELKVLIHKCAAVITEVYNHMDEHGVSVALVFHLERIESLLRRMQTLTDLVFRPSSHPTQIQDFLSLLIVENVRSRSLWALAGDNISLIARKITETSADTGEHYITRNRAENWDMLKRSWGGGLLTGFTTLFKLLLSQIHASPFVSGLMASVNYSVSFVCLHTWGFFLATKQPAMTAASLAHKMHDESSEEGLEDLTEEIFCLIRSQVTAVFGNIMAVIPTMVLIYFLFTSLGTQLLTDEKAEKMISDFSVLGVTPLYAALTGCLLFASSIFAGWFHNWMIYRKLPKALAQNRTLIFALGASGARKLGLFIKKNTSGFTANLSLGFLLGMTPLVAGFFGIPFDVRHVTLSTGALSASAMKLGTDVFSRGDFWLAAVGVLSMGALNLLVSFLLAMWVALRAQKIRAPQRSQIYAQFWRRFKRRPLDLFFPPAMVKSTAGAAIEANRST